MWNLGRKLCSISPGKQNVSRVAFQEFNIRFRIFFSYILTGRVLLIYFVFGVNQDN